jgi:hypothetical protein
MSVSTACRIGSGSAWSAIEWQPWLPPWCQGSSDFCHSMAWLQKATKNSIIWTLIWQQGQTTVQFAVGGSRGERKWMIPSSHTSALRGWALPTLSPLHSGQHRSEPAPHMLVICPLHSTHSSV